jgi:hypothetical protein
MVVLQELQPRILLVSLLDKDNPHNHMHLLF